MQALGAFAGLAGTLWLGLWLANIGPWGVDLGSDAAPGTAVTIDLALIALFGLQHSIMARPAWKRRVGQSFPERSAYLLATTAALAVLFLLWRAIPQTAWQLPRFLTLGQAIGASLAIWAVKTLDARAFLGLRPTPPGLATNGPYRFLRHPILVGTLLVLWCVPQLTLGHLLFSALMTAYALIGTWFESRDLAAAANNLLN